MSQKKMRICVVDTVYTLFLYLLIGGYNEEDFFIFSDGIPKSIRDNIPHYFFPHIRFNFDRNENILKIISMNFIPFFRQFFSILKLRCVLFIKSRNKIVYAYGQGHVNFSFPLYESENNAIIEDGLGNYSTLEKPTEFNPILEKFIHFLGFYTIRFYEGFGTHENIKKICLTRDDAPDIIRDKVEVFKPDELWENKSSEEQTKILELFNINTLNDLNDDAVLLLTEPFSEEGLIPFDEEMEIYKSIIEEDNNVFIKTHPRETKDYSAIFPNINVINVPFPVELLKYVGLSIGKIITFGSTAALNFEGYCEIEVYDKKTSSERINESCLLLKEKLK